MTLGKIRSLRNLDCPSRPSSPVSHAGSEFPQVLLDEEEEGGLKQSFQAPSRWIAGPRDTAAAMFPAQFRATIILRYPIPELR